MMKRGWKVVASAFGIVLLASIPAMAGSSGGSTSGELLRLGYGAHAPAVGGIMPAGARGLDAAWYNPAGLSAMSGGRSAADISHFLKELIWGRWVTLSR
ncbi:MAG: hypothetical protein D6679_04225 [Candidatus Hydrogenedentota bacterium]|nr:MAG: hypothetical protein D6679_04225 [Candidatus Hydrogenedentota bacterium]